MTNRDYVPHNRIAFVWCYERCEIESCLGWDGGVDLEVVWISAIAQCMRTSGDKQRHYLGLLAQQGSAVSRCSEFIE